MFGDMLTNLQSNMLLNNMLLSNVLSSLLSNILSNMLNNMLSNIESVYTVVTMMSSQKLKKTRERGKQDDKKILGEKGDKTTKRRVILASRAAPPLRGRQPENE